MIGIERIKIISGSDWKGDYQQKSRDIEPFIDSLYPSIFAGAGMSLAGNEVSHIECTIDDASSRYDWQEGIDVILHFADGTKGTMQEKFLTYHISTITFETAKTSGKKGAWFYCTAQYYFVSYSKRYGNGDPGVTSWMLVNLPKLHQMDMTSRLEWKTNQNRNYGRGAAFKFLHFKDVPADAVLSVKHDNTINK